VVANFARKRGRFATGRCTGVAGDEVEHVTGAGGRSGEERTAVRFLAACLLGSRLSAPLLGEEIRFRK